MNFVEKKDSIEYIEYVGREFSKIMVIKGFQENYGARICLTYLGLRIYYWWFCYTALVLTNLFIVSVYSGTIALKDEERILGRYNLLVDFALYSTVPPVHEHHRLLNCFWRNNV